MTQNTKQKEVVAEYSDSIGLTMRAMAEFFQQEKDANAQLRAEVREFIEAQTKKATKRQSKPAKAVRKALPPLNINNIDVVVRVKAASDWFFKKLGANITEAEPSEYTRIDGKTVPCALVKLDNGESYNVTANKFWKKRT